MLQIASCYVQSLFCRALPESELVGLIAQSLVSAGLLTDASSPFAAAVSGLVKGSVDMLADAAAQVPALLGYPLSETVQSAEFKPVRSSTHIAFSKAFLQKCGVGPVAAFGVLGYLSQVLGCFQLAALGS